MKNVFVFILLAAFSAGAAEPKLGDWHVIGPFKDEEFGNMDRTLAYRFGPELDYFKSLGIALEQPEKRKNLALSATASSPDGIPAQGHNPGGANDGNPDTYWDDQDHGKEYVLQLDWKKAVSFSNVRISGYKHHNFAPKSFALVADGDVIAEVKHAEYTGNEIVVTFPSVKAKRLELRISEYFGGSPAVREIEVYKALPIRHSVNAVTSINLSGEYKMKPFPGYLDLDRKWEVRKDYADGFYNLLPRGPAPSRMEAVYLYRTIESDCDQEISIGLRFQDCYKVWLNGENVFTYDWMYAGCRYKKVDMRPLRLKKGTNHLLIKNVSRWAEHGFAFAVKGMHRIKDPFYCDINAVDQLTAADYLARFKFKAEPIPMYSPADYDIEKTLESFKATPAADQYDRKLKELQKKTEQALASGNALDAPAMKQEIDTFLEKEIQKLSPILFIKKPLHDQNAIAPYATYGSLPAAICMLDPSMPDAEPKVIFSEPEMRINDMSLSFDGQTIFFSAKKKNIAYGWNIYEVGVDGTGLKQITDGNTADISPIELPNGRLAFISTRANTWVECQGKHAGLLYSMARDGSDVRLLSANIDSDHSPRVTNDGRIMFTRWDYGVEKNVFARHGLWTVNPDGTNLQLVFGNTIEDPGGFWWAQPIPDRPEILSVFGPHHNHHAGMIGLVWNGNGPEAPRGAGYRWITRETPVYGDKTYADGYRTPFALNEKQFLVSYGGEKHRPEWVSPEPGNWKIKRPYDKYTPLKLLYLDAYGNEKIIYEAGDHLSCYNPWVVQPRKRPPVIADKVPPVAWNYSDPEEMNRTDAGADMTATMMLQDVYLGISEYVKRGEAKYIAVMEQVQKSRRMAGGEAWGHTPIIGRGTVHARRLIGLVPVEDDGSAFFKVPALRSVSLNVLDEDGRTLMRMGSDLHVMPHENLSCVGCHEQRELGYGAAPPNLGARAALRKAPVVPQKQGWGTQGLLDYCTVVQPVWDKHCIKCHSGPLPKGGVNLTGDKTRFHNQSYDQLVDRDIVDHLSVFSLDHDETTPKTVGAIVSRIDEFMDKTHCGSELSWDEKFRVYCWIDANVPYYATYDYATVGTAVRGIGARDAWESKSKDITWAQGDLQEISDRRCADCHERDALNQSWLPPLRMKVRSDLWGDKALTSHGFGTGKWNLVNKLGPEFRINLTNPSHSSFLQAPLAKAAGGAGMCSNEDGSPVFGSKDDPDYQKALRAIQFGGDRLEQYPRIDMMGKEAFMNPMPQCSPANNPGNTDCGGM
ncbi:hypothetical protein P4B35_12510 [Pontiellaceae bacterium B12227]|nr:hypothetical protein [Pontiellaceae bacterium B12227]